MRFQPPLRKRTLALLWVCPVVCAVILGQDSPTVLGQDFPEPGTLLLGVGDRPDLTGPYLAYECAQDADDPSFDRGEAGICVYDVQAGTFERITEEEPDERHREPSISLDGRFVAFKADRRPPSGSQTPWQIYLYDRDSGEDPELITAAPDGTPGNDDTRDFELVSDVGFGASVAISLAVVFFSDASNLVPGDTTYTDAFLWRRHTGEIERLSLAYDGSEPESPVGTAHGGPPGIVFNRFLYDSTYLGIDERNPVAVFSADRYVENLIPNDENGEGDVFLRDRLAGNTIRLSETPDGEGGDCNSHSPDISGDGRFVSFVSCAENLGVRDGFRAEEILVLDRKTGQFSRATPAFDDSGPDGDSGVNYPPQLSPYGRFVLFDSRADNLVPNDEQTGGGSDTDIFLRDRATQNTYLVSLDEEGNEVDDPLFPTMDVTGRYIAWNTSEQQPDGSYLPFIRLRDRGDTLGPNVSNEKADPSSAPLDDVIELTATADDTAEGNLHIASASYQIDGGLFRPMEADDGAFDSPVEDVVAVLETNRLGSGTHEICVRAKDTAGNAELPECFEVEVEAPLSDLRVRCTHSPIWPQSDAASFTVTAEALTGSAIGDLNNNDITPVAADSIEIWVGNSEESRSIGAGQNVETHSETIDLTGGITPGLVTYGCLVNTAGVQAFSGWRTVGIGRVGFGDLGGPVPVIYNGPSNEKVDIVFIPDQDDYTGPEDSEFQTDTLDVIRDAYYSFPLFLVFQERFNFWVAGDTGDAERDGDECTLTWPDPATSRLSQELYAHTDAGAILHRDTFRDCATRGLFSSEPFNLDVVLHETGHRPFGLADEYCCDGGYFQTRKFPNVYRELKPCQDDAPDLGRTASECRLWNEDGDPSSKDWATSEPNSDDLMNDNRTPRAADIRRILWLFRRCSDGKC